MTNTLTVPVTHDYSLESLTNIDIIDFTNAAATLATATFDSTQFGTGLISDTVHFDASLGKGIVVVNGDSINASQWTFNGWSTANSVRFSGSSGNDTILGSSENDIFTGGLGADDLHGGDGDDVYRYAAPSELIGDNVAAGNGFDTLEITGGDYDFSGSSSSGGIDALRFTNTSGTTSATFASRLGEPHITAITGSAGVNALVANLITDEDLSGLTFTAGTWTDGIDTITMNGDSSANSLTGSSKNDFINGGGGDDTLNGGDGDDTLDAGDGADSLSGGDGDDVFSLADHVSAGDVIDGGTGSGDEVIVLSVADLTGLALLTNIEKLSFGNGGATTAFASGLQIRAGAIATVTGSSQTDNLFVTGTSVDLSGVAFVSWTANSDQISIHASNAASTLIGSDQIDFFSGGGSNDTMRGGAGNDLMDGQAGTGDTAVYAGSWGQYTIGLIAGNYAVADSIANRDGSDTVANVETFTFSNGSFSASAILNDAPIGVDDVNSGDTITAGTDNTASGNVLSNDTDADSALGDTQRVTGARKGAESTGVAVGALGTISGVHGKLTLNFDGSYTYVLNGSDAAIQALSAGQVATDVFTYRLADGHALFDHAQLTIAIAGGNDAPVITSNDGGATAAISIAENTTTVTAVTSTDVDTGSVRTYSLAGGADQAKFQIDASTGALTFIVAPDFETPTDAGGDNVYDVIVRASDGGPPDDQSIAVTVTNVVGHTINGTKKADKIDSTRPAGNTVTGEEDIVDGKAGNDTIKGAGGNDTLKGNVGNDSLSGETGNDFLRGGLGKDVIDGGKGIDTVDFSDKTASVVLKLNGKTQVTATVGGVAEDKIKNVENITGGSKNDTLTGDSKANVLIGNVGNDKLDGGSGSDTMDGGLGNDTLIGGSGSNLLIGGAGKDTFVFNSKGAGNTNTITDFTHNTDKLGLDDAVFTGIGTKLDAKEFYAAAGAIAAHDLDDRIVYDMTTGSVYFDVDGNKVGGKPAVLIGAFMFDTTAPTLSIADFVIV